ncbi:unnamed protein product [Calicophoron daubneyi]|uniref:V-type proton ATPase subunit n=1 Tax=Calicophoron daubneyi TaxID=300641 RepID=A0AAV2T7G1_CALDB
MDVKLHFFIPLAVVTVFWGLVALMGSVFVPKGANRHLLVISIYLTAACCYIFTYLLQYRPLIGPILSHRPALIVRQYWEPRK